MHLIEFMLRSVADPFDHYHLKGDAMQPARRVVTRAPHRSVGLVACSWLQPSPVEYESQLERRFIHRALLFPWLKELNHQPFSIQYTLGEANLKYTPDFLCSFTDGTRLVVEVKPDKFVEKERAKLDAAKAQLEAADIVFAVVTDRQIDVGNIPFNVSFLLRYARGEVSAFALTNCETTLMRNGGPLPINELARLAGISLYEIFHLIGRGRLSVPLNQIIDEQTPVSLPIKDICDASLFFCDWIDATPWR